MAIELLIVAPAPARDRIAHALRRELDATVTFAEHAKAEYLLQHRSEYKLVLLDENLAAADLEATQVLYAGMHSSLILEMNLAICSTDRVLRQVRAALQRRAADEARAHATIAAAVGHECNASLTGLLLESQLALRQAPPQLAPTLQRVVHMASALRDRFRAA